MFMSLPSMGETMSDQPQQKQGNHVGSCMKGHSR
uniref:Uncharacterized protein n=1 Tax=Picea sitchensis TaxID=3332 RepID=D5A980_PICSI|nr:unknown [Picea sitchensis]